MPKLTHLFENNREWSAHIREKNPDFFRKLSQQQSPGYLWIGCSDSRVPANEIVGLLPGELFVHRNVANLVVHTDLNCLSVMQFAVDILKVRHIIVCGHYGCGGVKAALSAHRYGVLDEWLRQIKDTYQANKDLVTAAGELDAQTDKLVEINIYEQLRNLLKTNIIQKAWHEDRRPVLHGWVYGLSDGLIKSLYTIEPGSPIEDIYRFKF